MATAPTPLIVSREAQKSLVDYCSKIFHAMLKNPNLRMRLLELDRLYYREMDGTEQQRRAQLANAAFDANKIQNVTVPVVAPQVDSMRAYFMELFLDSYPIFPVVADPQYADAALQLETVIGKSAVFHQWAKHLGVCFHDGLKYNLQALEVEWWRSKVPSVVQDNEQNLTQGSVKETIFEGCKLKRIDPYNLIFDIRVPPSECHTRGEFVGYSELITRTELKQLFLDLDTTQTMNATEAFQSGTATVANDIGTSSFYIPQVNPAVFREVQYTGFNWLQWANVDTKKKIRYSDMYEKTVLYLRIIPKEHFLYGRGAGRNPGDPQIYKIILINQKVPVYVARMTNAHNMLPIIIGQMNEDGLGLQTKSYAENAAPYQQIASALWNSGIHSQRRKVYDRIFYDPSRINKSDIDRVDPVARIPVKSDGYGKPISEALYQVPFRDEGVAAILGMAREVVDMADKSTGTNRIQQGQFQKGNKTRYEVESVMGNSDARPRVAGIILETSWLAPVKEIIKYNFLQFQPPVSLFNPKEKKTVEVDPATLRKVAWEFQLADGVLPSEKLLNFGLFGQALQYGMSNPAAAAEWDLTGMFVYQLKMQGARWVDQFHRTPEQQQQYMARTQQLTNPPAAPAAPTAPGAAQ